MKGALIYFLTIFCLAIGGAYGWIENIIWTFHQHEVVQVILGVVGIIVAPVGAIHGWLI